MDAILAKAKDLSTIYLYTLILGTAIFTISADCISLKKKKLFREEKICKFIGYGYIVIAVALFVVTRFII